VAVELRLTAALLNDVADLPLSVSTTTASGGGTLAYSAGVFTFAPADLSSYATQTYVDTAVADLVDSAPAALDTLNELAAALGDDANFSTTVTNSIATKWTQDNTKISNWDTAYSWGDHSLVGYITDLSSFTTTDLTEGTNLYYTDERVDDRVNALIIPGLGITTAYDDTAGTLTVESDTIEELCKNGTGSTILKGTPVYQTGTAGNAMVIAPADASSAATMPAVGVLSQDLVAEAEGNLILMGRISGVDTSAFGEGDIIYVASGGGYTNVRPTGQSVLVQNLGRVTKVHASNGGGVIMGAGRSNDVPNLTDGNVFIGNAGGTYDKRALVAADITDATVAVTDANLASFVTAFTLPVSDGTSGQALVTDGSGTIAFGDVDALPSQTGNDGYFLTTDGTIASWAEVAAGEFVYTRTNYTATLNQTTFSATYDVGYVDVFLNGIKLLGGTEFTATSGTDIVLAAGAAAGDIVEILAINSITLVDTYTRTEADVKFSLPSQTGNSGYYLTTDGADASWAEIPSSDRYNSKVISSDTTLDADTHYFTGSGTTINDGVTLTIPANTFLEVKLYTAGKAL
jgi:hypothetical protein